MYLFLNGEFLPETEARVSVMDRGFLYGDGVFETMRAYRGHIFRLGAHLQRLFRGLDALMIRMAWTPEYLHDVLYRLLEVNGLDDAYLRLTVSRGTGGRGIEIKGCGSPTVAAFARELSPHPPELYSKGVRLRICEERRSCRAPGDSYIKPLSFLGNILARAEASGQGAFEALMLNHDGHLSEGTVSNLFFVTGGVLRTPSVEAGILRGVTREVVLEAAKREGIPVEEGLFGREDLYRAEEVFLTSSVMEIMPVAEIDGRRYQVGAVTKRLGTAYREMVEEEILGKSRTGGQVLDE